MNDRQTIQMEEANTENNKDLHVREDRDPSALWRHIEGSDRSTGRDISVRCNGTESNTMIIVHAS